MSDRQLFSQIRKDIRSALFTFFAFAVVLIVSIESYSLFNRRESVTRLALEQVERIARAKLMTNDLIGVQQELSHFVSSMQSSLPYSTRVKVLLDGKIIAGDGDLREAFFTPATIQQISELPSGHRLHVLAEVGLKKTFIEALSILAIILVGCFGLYRTLIYRLEASFDRDANPIAKKLKDGEVHEQRVALAEQVAHDIRSPLFTLDSVIRDLRMPDEDRATISRSLFRIRDVLNDIGKYPQPGETAEPNPPAPNEFAEELLNPIIDEIVAEKRRQWSGNTKIELRVDSDNSARAFAVKGNHREISRAVSNLLDNALQAMEDKRGIIKIAIGTAEGAVFVSVTDAGKGMTEKELEKLGQRGVSFGKRNGTGLGVSHARQMMESVGGKLVYKSTPGNGTIATLEFPQLGSASPIPTEICLPASKRVVLIDDDPLVHQATAMKLKPFGVEIRSYLSPEEFEASPEATTSEETLFLVDFEFTGRATTGVELIHRNELVDRAVLVSGQTGAPEVRLQCEFFGIRRFPKAHLAYLPFRQEQRHFRTEFAQSATGK